MGARLYHVVTDYELFRGHLERVFDVTQGGLGLPGVIEGGAIGAAIGARRCGVQPLVMFDVIAPGSRRRASDRPLGELLQPDLRRCCDPARRT